MIPSARETIICKKDLRILVSAICASICVCCPLAIAWLGEHFGNDPLPDDHPYPDWPGNAVDILFLLAFLATISFILSARRWWWLAAVASIPLLILTAALAVTCGMWIDGTYF